jgi:hypothetical protein
VIWQVSGAEAADVAEAWVAVQVVRGEVRAVRSPASLGIHFRLRAVERQMLRERCGRGGTGGGLFVVCRQGIGTCVVTGESFGSAYLRVDA